MASDIKLDKDIVRIEGVNTNVTGNLKVIGNFFPTRINFIDHKNRNKMKMTGSGRISISSELKIPLKKIMNHNTDPTKMQPIVKSTDELTEYDCVARNMRWLLDRIEVLEARLGITEPTAFPKVRGRG